MAANGRSIRARCAPADQTQPLPEICPICLHHRNVSDCSTPVSILSSVSPEVSQHTHTHTAQIIYTQIFNLFRFYFLRLIDISQSVHIEAMLRQPDFQTKAFRSTSKAALRGALALQKALKKDDRNNRKLAAATGTPASKKKYNVANSKCYPIRCIGPYIAVYVSNG